MGFLQFAYSVKNIESDRWLDEQSLERKRESFHPTENTVSKLGGGFLTETCSKGKTQISNRKFFFFFLGGDLLYFNQGPFISILKLWLLL